MIVAARMDRRLRGGFSCGLIMTAVFFLLCISGCGQKENPDPGRLVLTGSNVRAGLLARPLDSEFRFSIYGMGENGPDKSLPVPNTTIAFRITGMPDGARMAAVSRETTQTDAGGGAVLAFVVGDKPGLYRLQAFLPDYPAIPPVNITVIGGVRVENGGQDGRVGLTLNRPLVVRMESAPGVPVKPDEGIVRFDLRQAPTGSNLSTRVARTDDEGVASTEIRLGENQGAVEVGVTVLSGTPDGTAMIEPMRISFFAIDFWAVAIGMFGGLALFLFGMKMTSESLQFVAGDKLRDLLNLLTTNRYAAVGAGAVVTALIQSSSACTVMVVGFVNAGLMKLEQAIGVIMGANIGTTITAQIISFKLTNLALPAVMVGVGVIFLAKRQTVKSWGSIIVGFGFIFLGMNIMSQNLGELRDSATVVSMFSNLNSMPGPGGYIPLFNFLKAVGVGLIVTLILQSSAATIGLLITVASAGLIDPYAAFGILLGDNIGTTITAILACIGTSATAKRAAVFHVMFNVFGCVLMICLNYVQWPAGSGKPVFMVLANMLTPGDVFRGGENLPRFLANAHTLFNVMCTGLFVSFVPQFARLCRFLVKDDPSDGESDNARRLLEPHLLAMPSLALQQVWTEVGVMLGKARKAQNSGFSALLNAPSSDWNISAREAKTLEKETDELKTAITKYLSGISLTVLNENQSEMFPHLIRTVNDAEKIADLGKHLSKLAKRVNKRSLSITPEAVDDLNGMLALVDEMLELAEKTVNINADGIELSGGGAVLRKKLLGDGKRLDKQAKLKASELRKNYERRHAESVGDIDNVKSSVVFLDVVNSLSRSAACAVNIVEASCHTINPADTSTSRRFSIRTKPGGGQ